MLKIIFIFVCMSMEIFSASQSTSLDCQYKSCGYGTLGTIYSCNVQNLVSINSSDAAQVDIITGKHLIGYNNDNVKVLQINNKQVHFFPRGLHKFFKNLQGIQVYNCSLKEIHQSDLKDFPNLKNFALDLNDFEILEENLFDFNINLEVIYLYGNKISHIDPNVFDKLTKLRYLYLHSNPCIDMNAENNSGQFQNLIRIAKNQCINSDYLNLEQKVKNLEAESKNLNSENFKKNFENLENEVKNSKFSRFFQDKLESLKAIKIEKAQKEVPEKIANLDKKLSKEISNLKNDVLTVKNAQPANIQKLDDVKAEISKNNQKIEELSQQITKVDEAASKFNKDTATTLKDIEAAIMNFIENLSKKMEAIEVKLAEMDSTQKKMMNKIHKIEFECH